ncbi:hypothetical protein [Rhodococcus sp. AQ5-07]|uniref:hypothetical protein n=1 Tax=Rhodococcus sp. AQ5-07 TaxID=2054902 RepID=UPI0012B5CB7F|nr:hypothetical protein [Rhodococcus sp. AQ5-07]
MNRLRSELTDLVAESTALLAAPVGVNGASTLLVTTGDNPERLRSEASFAALCGSLRSRRPQESTLATGQPRRRSSCQQCALADRDHPH